MKNVILSVRRVPLILLSTFIAYGLYAQNEVGNDVLLGKHINPKFEKKERQLINKWGLDFQLLGTSVHFATKIRTDFYWGIEAGLLPNLFDWVILGGEKTTQENTIWSNDRSDIGVNDLSQLIFGQAFVRWKPESGWIEMDAGLRAAVFTRSGYDVDDLGLATFYGSYLKPLLGSKRIKAGVQFEIGRIHSNSYYSFSEFVIIASPLIRINFR